MASVTSGGGQTRSLGLVDDDRAAPGLGGAGGEPPACRHAGAPGRAAGERERSLLGTFANQAALAVDRAQLREQALRARLLEEIDRWRRALMGAASHDLRTPLASIKTAVSSLRQVDAHLSPEDRAELLELIELQSDRLARLVTNLLDMTRMEAGALELRPTAIAFDELVDEALASLGGIVTPGRVAVDAPVGPAAPASRSRPHEPGPGERARERRPAVAPTAASSAWRRGPHRGARRRGSRSR